MWTSTWITLIAIASARLLYTFMILTCSSIRLTTHLIRIILTHALTFYARFRALSLFLQKALFFTTAEAGPSILCESTDSTWVDVVPSSNRWVYRRFSTSTLVGDASNTEPDSFLKHHSLPLSLANPRKMNCGTIWCRFGVVLMCSRIRLRPPFTHALPR